MTRDWLRRMTWIAVASSGCQISGPRTSATTDMFGPRRQAENSSPVMRTVGGYREIVQPDGQIVQIPETAALAIESSVTRTAAKGERLPVDKPESTREKAPPAPDKSTKPDFPTPPKRDESRAERPIERPTERRAGDGTAQDPKVAKYILKPGDRLEIVYTEAASDDSDYRLQAGDDIRIEYLHLGLGEVGANGEGRAPASTLDRNVRLQPDGKISLPYIGLLPAAGRNVAALADVLNERYRKFYVEPRMHVTLVATGSQMRDLREGQHAAGGHLLEVSPEGRINLPYLGQVTAADLTLAELQTELTERHKKLRPGWSATVRLVRGWEK